MADSIAVYLLRCLRLYFKNVASNVAHYLIWYCQNKVLYFHVYLSVSFFCASFLLITVFKNISRNIFVFSVYLSNRFKTDESVLWNSSLLSWFQLYCLLCGHTHKDTTYCPYFWTKGTEAETKVYKCPISIDDSCRSHVCGR